MTEKLYYDDPDLLEFTARVIGVHSETEDNRVTVLLDRTAFYPEGGGQPCDLGTLGGLPVIDVQKRDDEIRHVVELSGPGVREGEEVAGRVDAGRRRDYRQQHTGQHIISAALVACGGHNTVSVHLGTDYSTIEIDSSSISAADLLAVEDKANATIESAVAVSTTWVGDSEIGSFPLRRPPKVSGTIRIVQVGDADCAACGGVHVGNSREVRLVRCTGSESIRGHVRLFWKIGDRALDDYRRKDETTRAIGEMMSAQPQEIADRVDRLIGQARELEARTKKQDDRICRLTAKNLLDGADRVRDQRLVTATFHDEQKGFLGGISKVLAEERDVIACLANVAGHQLQWSIVAGSAAGADVPAMLKTLLPVVEGRGGGKPPIWQGIGMKPESVAELLDAFRELSAG